MKQIDVRGLSCPEPVLRARAAMDKLSQGEQVELILDSQTSLENVSRAAKSMKCDLVADEPGSDIKIVLTRK